MKAQTESWRFVLGSYFGFLLFVLFGFSLVYRGIWFLLPVALFMIIVPSLDFMFGKESKADQVWLSRLHERLVECAPSFFVVGNALVIGLTARRFASFTSFEKLLSIVSVGMIGGIGISAAHELVHKSQPSSKWFGRLGLANVLYLHFEISHIRGHHVWVGTEKDQSTAWLGESLYSFLVRTLPGCFGLSWKLESTRLIRKGVRPISLSNQMLQFAVLQSLYLSGVWFLGGRSGLSFFVFQAFVSVFMLESVSYIEHYGLCRARRPDGKYESMSPADSWDCYGRFSNYLVFQLERHADHHSHPTRPFSELRTAADAPKLPIGYPLLIGVAMVPPLWRRMMDPRVAAARSEKRRRPLASVLRTLEA